MLSIFLSLAAVVVMIWREERRVKCALLPLCALSVVWVSADCLLGGLRATVSRYFLPAGLLIHASLALAIAHAPRKVGGALLGLLLLAGGVSAVSYASSRWWWTKFHNRPEMASGALLNGTPGARLYTSLPPASNASTLMALALETRPDVPVWVSRHGEAPPIPGADPVFLLDPDEPLRSWAQQYGRLTPVGGLIFRLDR